jgi:hypothetical protein
MTSSRLGRRRLFPHSVTARNGPAADAQPQTRRDFGERKTLVLPTVTRLPIAICKSGGRHGSTPASREPVPILKVILMNARVARYANSAKSRCFSW